MSFLKTPARRAFVVTAISLVLLLSWNAVRTFKHPWGDLAGGTYTDHLSHMNAARAFPRVGLDIWRRSAIDLSRAPTAAERAAWPADVHPGGSWKGGVYVMDGWPADKPWVTSWGQIPRLYPPGDMLLVAPVSLAYHFTSLSLTQANRWLFALFLVYAHVSIFLMLEIAFEERDVQDARWAPYVIIPVPIAIYILLVFWSLQGFYDAAAVAPLLLCARYLAARRGLAAGVAYTAAAFLHFRALFLAPWFVAAAWLFFYQREWQSLRARDLVAMAIGAALGVSSLATLWLVRPALGSQHVNNPVNLGAPSPEWLAIGLFLAVVTLAAGVLGAAKAWLDLATLAWLAFMILMVKEAHEWHIVVPLAWVASPVSVPRPRPATAVRGVRLLFVAYVAARVMVN